MESTSLFVHNGGTTSQALGAATIGGVNMPLGSQTIEDMNRTIFPLGTNTGQQGSDEEPAYFGTHIKEAVAIVKDWTGSR